MNNVGELIEALSKLDKSLPVYVTCDYIGDGAVPLDIGFAEVRNEPLEAGGEDMPVPWVEIGVSSDL
jgi:hypothetical protein